MTVSLRSELKTSRENFLSSQHSFINVCLCRYTTRSAMKHEKVSDSSRAAVHYSMTVWSADVINCTCRFCCSEASPIILRHRLRDWDKLNTAISHSRTQPPLSTVTMLSLLMPAIRTPIRDDSAPAYM